MIVVFPVFLAIIIWLGWIIGMIYDAIHKDD